MASVILDSHAGVIEHDGVVYPDKLELESTPKSKPKKKRHGKHYTIVLHLH